MRAPISRFSAVLILALCGCGKINTTSTDDVQELGQSIGDVAASIDEASGSNAGNGAFARAPHESNSPLFARHGFGPGFLERIGAWAEPPAMAASCLAGSVFSSCINNNITHDFNGCSVGSATFTGNVSLAFTDAGVDNSCMLASSGHSVLRTPAFSVSGRRGATLSVNAPGGGQLITRGAAAGTYTLTVGGIRRVFSSSNSTFLDLTTSTTSPIGITGINRLTRLVNNGTLRILDNKSGVFCDVSPANVAWSSNACNCPTSGTWQGNCSNGKTFSLTHSGCGTGNLTVGDLTTSFSFDRCG